MEKPSQEQFDAMSDVEFDDWWDAFVAGVQRHAVSEAEVEAADRERQAACLARWDDGDAVGAIMGENR